MTPHSDQPASRDERELLTAELMKLLRPEPTRVKLDPKPTVQELEDNLNSHNPRTFDLNADGNVYELIDAKMPTMRDMVDCMFALGFRRSAPEGVEDWLDIGTCPRNGANFLACSEASSVFLAHWANGVVDSSNFSDDGGYASRHATKWQPLPLPHGADKTTQALREMVISSARKSAPNPPRPYAEIAREWFRKWRGAQGDAADVAALAALLADVAAKAGKEIGPELEAFKFPRGARVRKIKGYKFEGRVNGTFSYFDNPDAPPFVNVQHDDGWIMHFRETELELIVNPNPQECAMTRDNPTTPSPSADEAAWAYLLDAGVIFSKRDVEKLVDVMNSLISTFAAARVAEAVERERASAEKIVDDLNDGI